ncbi:MAG: hypothetical protein ABW098_10090 [Candidatus Thiodiazotropha sp.]
MRKIWVLSFISLLSFSDFVNSAEIRQTAHLGASEGQKVEITVVRYEL